MCDEIVVVWIIIVIRLILLILLLRLWHILGRNKTLSVGIIGLHHRVGLVRFEFLLDQRIA